MAGDSNTTVVVSEYTEIQGGGWAVDQYGPRVICGYNERITQSRWASRERAIEEGRKLAEQLDAPLYIY